MLQEQDITVVSQQPNVVAGELRSNRPDLQYLKTGALVILADGLDNLLDYVAQAMPTPRREGRSDYKGWWGEFNAFPSYQHALEVFRHQPETVVKFDPGQLRVTDSSESGNRVNYEVVGDYIDMGRYMEGVPESWGYMLDGSAHNRRVNLLIDLSQPAYASERTINHRGERILRLVDALEAAGVRTQLTAIESTQCGHMEVILKPHDEALTITDLAVVVHSEFLRRICFRIIEYSKTWEEGYGNSNYLSLAVNARPEMLRASNNDEINIYIAGGMSVSNINIIDDNFSKLERLLQWELSKPVPEVDAIKIDSGIYFSPNGYRAEADIRREGLEVINGQ